MSDQPITLQLEIPLEIAQQDVWNLEEQCQQVAGITTDLQEPRDLIAATLLFIHFVGPYLGQATAVAGGIKTTRDLAQILYNFLHPTKQETDGQQYKNKVVIIKKGIRIELYNLSPQEIEKVLES
jgi:Trk-type K+ transport system membrane component